MPERLLKISRSRAGFKVGPVNDPQQTSSKIEAGTEGRCQVLFEIGVVFLICVVLLFLSSIVAGFGGFWAENAGTLPAAFCLLFPVIYAQRRDMLPAEFGLTSANLWKSILVVLITAAIVFPVYVVGFVLWSLHISDHEFKGFAAGFAGRTSGQTVWWLANLLFVQVFAVALPEEVFYRGWMQTRLAVVFRRRINILGAPFGLHIVVASALFALSHLVLVPAPFRLAVFFPGLLFGYLRERTGSVVAPAILHAFSNILLTLIQQYF